MTEERLTKKSVVKAEQLGSINLLDDAYAILKKHNITYNNYQIKNMTVNQWRRLVQKKVNDTVNKEIIEESSQKSKLCDISGANAELKNYLKALTWENSRTVFEVRTNMLKLNSNYGQKDEQCYICGKQKTTRHIFECEGSTVKGLTLERYKQMIGKEGPQTDEMNSVSQSAEIVRKKMEERSKIKTIVNKYGWEDNLHSRGVSDNGSAEVQDQGRTLRSCRNTSRAANGRWYRYSMPCGVFCFDSIFAIKCLF